MATERILVTGATGFVGRHLIPQVLVEQRNVTLAVRSAARVPAEWADHPAVRVVETGPLETAQNLDAALAEASAVVHLAGRAHVRAARDAEPFMQANARATEALARAAAATGAVRTFVHLSSIFSTTGNVSRDIVGDDTPPAPTTSYGASKLAAEAHVASLASENVLAISLRPTLIVGSDAGGNWRALQKLAATGLPLPFASVRNRRSLVSVQTVVRAIAHLCRPWPAEEFGNYALADDGALSLPEIVTELRAGMGLPPRLVPFPVPLLTAAAAALGQANRAAGLLGALEGDAARFHEVFGFPAANARDAVRASGAAYIQQRRAAP